MRATWLLLVLPLAVQAGPKPGAEGTPEYRAAAELVRQLGDPKFSVREAAAKKLVDLGAAAVPALADGAQSADEEVRARSAALLPRAEAVGWGRRADAFLADRPAAATCPCRPSGRSWPASRTPGRASSTPTCSGAAGRSSRRWRPIERRGERR